ncbi:MAG: serine/threonine protein kinase [Acidobacteria bacterium]|nr:serine/threonine protein kinase [Acidobacteriota bacterium]MDA1236713.1 serine/threonine protein kinase [Acidobacteriota bacterium]
MDRIGRYRIIDELGRGAMGVVYRAEDPKIGREVAIKTLKLADKADASEIDGLRERLMREAQSAGRLSHPGIVTVYDVDEDQGVAFIAMEYVEGKTFDDYLRDGLIHDLNFAADVLLQAAAALDYAHSKEIVHRDIKPANLMLTARNVVKIMDFGIARISSSQLTQTGTVMGTPSYMSPEQVRGEGLDGRADQFSLGVIAYEMLTGKKPFAGDNLTAVIFKIVSSEPVKATQLCPWLGPEVDAVIARVLAKKAEDRYKSCQAFAESFRAAVQAVVVPTDAEVATSPGLDPSITQDVSKEAAGANDETQISTSKMPALEEPPTLPPIEPIEPTEKSSRGRWIGWVGGLAAVGLLAFAGAVQATTGDLFANPVEAARQAWSTWFDAAELVIEAEGLPVPPIDWEPVVAEPVETTTEGPPPTAVETAATPPPVAAPAPVAAPTPQPTVPAASPPVVAAPKRAPRVTATSVYFRTTPPGATVVVDTRAEWTCRTPCRIEKLPRGSRTVIARLAGFQTTRRTFQAGADSEMIVEIELEDSRVQLLITSQPSGADIYVDGRLMPQKTDAKIPLPEGTYRVRVSKAGVGEAEQVVQVDRQSLPFAQFVLEKPTP